MPAPDRGAAAPPAPLSPLRTTPGTPSLRTVRVAARWPEARHTLGLALVADDGQPLPAATAGAHLDLHLPGGVVRPYSLCAPHHPGQAGGYRLAVLHQPGGRGGSAAVHRLQLGSRLQVGPPRNLFPLDETAPHSLLLAAGIGITPLLAMAWRLAELGRSFGLHYAARSADDAAGLAQLRAAPWAAQVQLYLAQPSAEAGPARRLPLAALLRSAPEGSLAYACGPSRFLDDARQQAALAGWAPGRLRMERFAPPDPPAAAAGPAPDGAFEVVLARSGQRVPVAAGQAITEALAAHGVVVPTACGHGICGTCATRVLQGEVVHHDFYLSDTEKAAQDVLLPCCARARSPVLVLDL